MSAHKMQMPEQPSEKPRVINIRDVYPTLTEQELKETDANLARYVATAFAICRDLSQHADRSPVDSDHVALKIEERSNVSFEK